jgi:hypothetical protein
MADRIRDCASGGFGAIPAMNIDTHAEFQD